MRIPMLMAGFCLLISARGVTASAPENACRSVTSAEMKYSVCTFPNDGSKTIRTYLKSADGSPYGTMMRLKRALDSSKLVFACNGSASQADLTPVGLFIEDSKETVAIVKPTDEGLGNLYIRPNGVFYVENRIANVVTTEEYIAKKPQSSSANQSGPMLVIKGEISARLDPHGTSLKSRNAVCVTANEKDVIFALTEQAENFYTFATFLKSIGCVSALNFDVTTSSFYAPSLGKTDIWVPIGAMIGVTEH